MSTSSRANLIRRISMDAMLCVLAMMLSYLEVILPLNLLVPLPGFRLGLANVAVVAVFCLFTPIDALAVMSVRILLMGLLFGSPTSLYFSAMGGLFSFAVLMLAKYLCKKCSLVGVSILCAAAHNTGQVIAAVTLFDAALITTYLPALLIASVIYGGIVGVLLNLLLPRLQKAIERGGGE